MRPGVKKGFFQHTRKTIENSVYENENAIHVWNRFKTNLSKEN